MNPTPEQQAIFDHVRSTNDHLIIEARAGSGKSWSLLKAIPLLRGTTSLQAFNKSIAAELQAKANEDLDFATRLNLDIRTCHSHGLSAWGRGRKPRVDGGKVAYIIKDILRFDADDGDDIWQCTSLISKLTGLAKSAGFGLSSAGEDFPRIEDMQAWHELADHFDIWSDSKVEMTPSLESEILFTAQKALKLSNQRENMVDFDDMIYLPLLKNMPLPTYDNILLDEAQDINATRREMAFRSLKPNGRLIAVGDRYQAIYGFTGASDTSLDDIRKRAGSCAILPLTTCWRCDGKIISKAQELVPDIQCKPGVEEAGKVASIPFEGIPALIKDGREVEPAQPPFMDLVQPGDAILCRLNKPNVAVALGLLRRGKPCRIEGRDLGKRLIFHVQRATERYAMQPLSETVLDLDTYKEQEIHKLLAKKRETAADLLEDEVECARLLAERCIEERKDNWPAFEQLVASLFADDVPARSFITLSSVHKSKGREWPRVFILGRFDYMPFWRAAEAGGWQLEQENNLIYVAITRAEHELYFVTGVKSALDRGAHREVKVLPVPEGITQMTAMIEDVKAEVNAITGISDLSAFKLKI